MFQVPPIPPPQGPLVELLSELVDAKWIITTMIALYAAALSTFNALVTNWWEHRPRLKVKLNEMRIISGNRTGADVLMATVANHGYQPRKMTHLLAFKIREVEKRPGQKNKHFAVLSPESDPALPCLLEPSGALKVWALKSEILKTGREQGLTGSMHVRAIVYDGLGAQHRSPWLKIDL